MVKKITRATAVIILAFLLLPLIPSVNASSDSDGMRGSGTVDDPFLVSSVNDLKLIGTDKYGMDKNYRQTKDIVFTENDNISNIRIGTDIECDPVKETITVTILINDSILQLNSDDITEVFINGTIGSVEYGTDHAVFVFPYDVFDNNDNNCLIIICDPYDNGLIGTVIEFTDIPHYVERSATANFIPIGTEDIPFTGRYDGRGNSISGMRVVSFSKAAGMFGYAKGANISSLNFVNGTNDPSYFLSASVSSSYSEFTDPTAGSIVGYCQDTVISMINNESTVVSFSSIYLNNDRSSYDIITSYSGGITGRCEGNMNGCSNNGSVISVSHVSLDDAIDALTVNMISGGITGHIRGKAVNCFNSGKITSSVSGDTVGGIDHVMMMTIDSGGIAGYADNTDIMNSTNNGPVNSSIRSDDWISVYSEECSGGIVGHAAGVFRSVNCFANTSFFINNEKKNNPNDKSSYGGLIGSYENDRTITLTSSACRSSLHPEDADSGYGGLIGNADAGKVVVNDSYYQDNGRPYIGSSTDRSYSKDLTKMKMNEYGGTWNFEKIWSIGKNGPVIDLKYGVRFVSDDLSLFTIDGQDARTNNIHIVNGILGMFKILPTSASDLNPVTAVDDDSGETVVNEKNEFMIPIIMNGSVPVDRVIFIEVSLNVYKINIISELPDGITVSMSPVHGVSHGSTAEVVFTGDGHDLSALDLKVIGNYSSVIYKGEGVYSITNVTTSVDIIVTGFNDRSDLVPIVIISSVSFAIAMMFIVIGSLKLMDLKRKHGVRITLWK